MLLVSEPRRRVPVAPPGWPRPWRWFRPDHMFSDTDRKAARLPVPWVIARIGRTVTWTEFHEDVDATARRCQVCGLELGKVILLGRVGRGKDTSGPGCHPRCFALALKFCPHFDEMGGKFVAYRYEGLGTGLVKEQHGDGGMRRVTSRARRVTREDVRALVLSDPMGDGRADAA